MTTPADDRGDKIMLHNNNDNGPLLERLHYSPMCFTVKTNTYIGYMCTS